ncbi:MAG: rod-binding protein [Firmicutes bacterium]|nr:rod-binding protein [Bacillota bacterium]HXL04320.1 rod-binding protein [Bacillota bacterium]
MNTLVRWEEGRPGICNFKTLSMGKTDSSSDDALLKKACSEFEAIFIESVIKAMRKTVPKDGLFSGGFGEEVFQELFDQEIACQITSRGGLGIADTLYNQLNAKKVYLQD